MVLLVKKMFKTCLIGQLEGVTKVLRDNQHNIWEKHTRNLHTKKVSKEKSICLSRLLQYVGQTLLGKYETTVHIKKQPSCILLLCLYTRGGVGGRGLLVLPLLHNCATTNCCHCLECQYWHNFDHCKALVLACLWLFWSANISTILIILKFWYWHACRLSAF